MLLLPCSEEWKEHFVTIQHIIYNIHNNVTTHIHVQIKWPVSKKEVKMRNRRAHPD